MSHKDQASQMQPVRPLGPGESGSVFGDIEVQLPGPSAEASLVLLVIPEPEQMMTSPAAGVALQG